MVSKATTWGRVTFGLAAIASTLPIFAGYTVSLGLLIWLFTSGRWRLALIGDRYKPLPGGWDAAFMKNAAAALKPLHWGTLALVLGQLVAALLGWAWSPWGKPLGKTLGDWSHVLTKLGLLWYLLSAVILVQVRLGWNPRRVGRFLLIWLAVQFVYCLVQHFTGIDWTHGFGAKLGVNRLTFGGYRVSGFMGHPLTFAYNMMLITLAALALAWRVPERTAEDVRWWLGCAVVCALTLLVSGSRYVLIILVGVLVLCEGRRLWQHKFKVLLLLAVAAGLLVWEGSLLFRFQELFRPDLSFDQRFPRLVFWRLHWQMFLDSPWFGATRVGLEEALKSYYSAAGYHDTIYAAHNLFLQFLADTGVVGFLGLLAWFVGLAVSWWRLRQQGAQGISYLALATILCALMQNNLRDSAYIYALWFYLSLLLVQTASAHATQQEFLAGERKSPQNLQSRARSADPAPDM